MSILKILCMILRNISEAFENYFVDYNSNADETYKNSSYIKKI